MNNSFTLNLSIFIICESLLKTSNIKMITCRIQYCCFYPFFFIIPIDLIPLNIHLGVMLLTVIILLRNYVVDELNYDYCKLA